MAENKQDIFASIASKVRVVVERQQQLAEAVAREKARREELQRQVEKLQTELQRLNADNEYLRVARIMSATPDEARDVRRRLDGLVRDINRCIAEFKAC